MRPVRAGIAAPAPRGRIRRSRAGAAFGKAARRSSRSQARRAGRRPRHRGGPGPAGIAPVDRSWPGRRRVGSRPFRQARPGSCPARAGGSASRAATVGQFTAHPGRRASAGPAPAQQAGPRPGGRPGAPMPSAPPRRCSRQHPQRPPPVAGWPAGRATPPQRLPKRHAARRSAARSPQGLGEKNPRCRQAIEQRHRHDGSSARASRPGAQGQQVAGQVAAVHRRDVERRAGLQRLGVVPVVEVAAVAFQPVHRARVLAVRSIELLRPRCSRSHRRQVGQQRQAHVGRRGAMRDRGDAVLLEVVGRQPVVFRADEGLEERPGAARQPPQKKVCSAVRRPSRRASGG
jgi:hypothetical protein